MTAFRQFFTVLLAALSVHAGAAGETVKPMDPATVAKLTALAKLVSAWADDPADEGIAKIAAENKKLSKAISDENLATVEQFGMSRDGKDLRWVLACLLVDCKKFDAAAHLFVEELVGVNGDLKYIFWKKWELYFGERDPKEYDELNRLIGVSLVHQFETGSAEYKSIVATLLGKGVAEAKMTTEDFKKAIHFEKMNPK
jgi:hypothetical protein